MAAERRIKWGVLFNGENLSLDRILRYARMAEEAGADSLWSPRSASSATFAFSSPENLRRLLLICIPPSGGGIHLKTTCPIFRGHLRRHVITPLDLETEYYITGGNIFHVSMVGTENLFANRSCRGAWCRSLGSYAASGG